MKSISEIGFLHSCFIYTYALCDMNIFFNHVYNCSFSFVLVVSAVIFTVTFSLVLVLSVYYLNFHLSTKKNFMGCYIGIIEHTCICQSVCLSVYLNHVRIVRLSCTEIWAEFNTLTSVHDQNIFIACTKVICTRSMSRSSYEQKFISGFHLLLLP